MNEIHILNVKIALNVFSELWREVIVRFVNFGEIVDHHCLDFLFITKTMNANLAIKDDNNFMTHSSVCLSAMFHL